MSSSVDARELELLREARRFLRTRARELEAMLAPSRALRARLERTKAYRRVDGRNDAESDPIWDVAGTLDVCFERVVTETMQILLHTARRAGRRKRRPARAATRG